MADIFKFQAKKIEDDEPCCEACQVTDEYLEIALKCKTEQELRVALRGLYDDAHKEGFRDALMNDIRLKADILDDMDEEGY